MIIVTGILLPIWLYVFTVWIVMPLMRRKAILINPKQAILLLFLMSVLLFNNISHALAYLFVALMCITVVFQYFAHVNIVAGASREKLIKTVEKVANGMGLTVAVENKHLDITSIGVQVEIQSFYQLQIVRFIGSQPTPKSQLFIAVVKKFITA